MELKKVSRSRSSSSRIFWTIRYGTPRAISILKKDGSIFELGAICARRSLFFVAEILCVHRGKKERMSVVRPGAEEATHTPPDRTDDLLLPFRSGDPLIQNLRKLQRSAERRGDGKLPGVVSWVILQSNCS